MEYRYLTLEDLNKTALEHLVYQPVSRDMIAYLADAATNVIACDSSLIPQPRKNTVAAPANPEARSVTSEDDSLPSVEDFITQLVISSNVQVPTLMSTLVYLGRLKSKLQPMARGLRCTTHRIFLACLILAAKYLNDSSPKNKHWANYSHINTDGFNFGFNRTEVNLMEKQLLFLLEWDLRITEEDLYQELDEFLEPLRERIAQRHWRKLQKRRQEEAQAAAAAQYPSPPASRATSRSRHTSSEQMRPILEDASTPPELTYSGSDSSDTSSVGSSGQDSRSNTPISESVSEPYSRGVSSQNTSPYNSQLAAMVEERVKMPKAALRSQRNMLPYEISAEQYQQMHHHQNGGITKSRQSSRRGVLSRLLGNNPVTVR